ncbi:hypothetical protein DL765_009897 [Monosporascus sp. GIB2]|nr:hypothetical protein DL765_009897 [Monosporascus sp. GIB2]
MSGVPKGLGTFPLFNTQPYRDQLPPQAASQGGLKQDYIITPEQKRLDGISLQPGIVKQFVAMKPNPDPKKDEKSTASSDVKTVAADPETARRGGTIEWQMTGRDEVKGIQLQIIPKFKSELMFAGSMKDACPRKLGGRLESYVPVPDDVANYDVLRTPEELGLRTGDTIHIRNLGLEREDDRSKRVIDLTLETPNPSDVLELEVFRSPMLEIVTSVRSLGSNHDAVLFKVDVDDELEDVQKAAQEIFQLPDGPRVDLILLPSIPKRVCHINFLNGADEEFNNIAKPLLVELPENSTVAFLRETLESVTKASTDGFRVASLGHPDLPDDHSIFDQKNIPERYSMPVLALDDGIALTVKALNGKVVRIHAWPEDVMENVMELIEGKTGVPPDKQRLIYGGKHDYGINRFATLHLVLRLRGGGYPVITVTLSGTPVFVGKVKDVAHLKAKIFETLGIYVHRQQFDLPDDFCLADKSLTLELKIHPQERVALGIGVGGNIIQEIVEDKSDPGIWDVGSSKILYVHIVNSQDFRAITGLPPPETPISWETYSDLRLPYDKAWGEGNESGKGISSDGAFDKLVGLEEGDNSRDDRSPDLSRVYASDDRCDSRSVPSFPLTLLEADQTVPWFRGLGHKGEFAL